MKTVFDQKALISLRRDKLWTQEDLAAASGVSTRTIQRIELGDGGSLETWKALAAASDVDVGVFEVKPVCRALSDSKIKLGYRRWVTPLPYQLSAPLSLGFRLSIT